MSFSQSLQKYLSIKPRRCDPVWFSLCFLSDFILYFVPPSLYSISFSHTGLLVIAYSRSACLAHSGTLHPILVFLECSPLKFWLNGLLSIYLFTAHMFPSSEVFLSLNHKGCISIPSNPYFPVLYFSQVYILPTNSYHPLLTVPSKITCSITFPFTLLIFLHSIITSWQSIWLNLFNSSPARI